MRLFIALPVPQPCREAIGVLMERLQKWDPCAFWESPEKLHLTLAFLGEQPRQEAALKALSQVESPAFPLCFPRLGRFPGKKRDVVFLRPEESTPLIHLQKQLALTLEKEGIFLEERPFFPHITLSRQGAKQVAWEKIPLSPLTFPAREVCLFKSLRSSSGASYHTLYQIHLEKITPTGRNVPHESIYQR